MAVTLWPIWLLLAGACYFAALRLGERLILPQLPSLDRDSSRGWREGWLPVLFALPLACLTASAASAGAPIAVATAPALLAPSLAALAALALHLPARRGTDQLDSGAEEELGATSHVLLWCVVGVIMLLLAATDRLQVWQGQCLLTGAIILFWYALPDVSRRGVRLVDSSHASGLPAYAAGLTGLLALLAAASAWFAAAGIAKTQVTWVTGDGFSSAALILLAGLAGLLLISPLIRVARVLGAGGLLATAAATVTFACWISLGLWTLALVVGRLLPGAGSFTDRLHFLLAQLMHERRLWFPLSGIGQTAFAAVVMIAAPLVFLGLRAEGISRSVALAAGMLSLLALVALVGVGALGVLGVL